MSTEGLERARDRMRARGLDERAVAVFEHAYRELEAALASGGGGTIREETIEPLTDLPSLDDVAPTDRAAGAALHQVVMVKLNGGLGTSMGMTGPKSALVVKDGLTFLDITARQVLAARRRHSVDLPLVLMNSFRTQAESLAILHRYPDLAVDGLPLDFLQNAEPKLRADDLAPVAWPADPELEWCPPGHGDVYVALATSGLLKTLRDRGFRYAFLSNADNLGATCDPRIAAWLVENEIPYAAEVCERTANDRKGGHLARRRSDGRIVLRDSAMVAEGEDRYFQDTGRHPTFHANNLWVDLDVLDRLLTERDGVLGLPVIVNRKTVDPADPSSTRVIQVETAMGTAIERIEGSRAIRVPRTRFRPVKSTNELLLVQSDFFDLDGDCQVVAVGAGPEPLVDLDPAYYRLLPAFAQRFPAGPPSLRGCSALRVRGDVHFGSGVVCTGDVSLDAPEGRHVPDGARLTGAH